MHGGMLVSIRLFGHEQSMYPFSISTTQHQYIDQSLITKRPFHCRTTSPPKTPPETPSSHSQTMSSDESQQRGWGECTLETCSVAWSIFQYQPNLVANAIFIAVFGVSMFIHIYQGYRWKQWTFAILVALGCVSEMIGHGGRIIMHDDPWDFNGFMLQISEFFDLRSSE